MGVRPRSPFSYGYGKTIAATPTTPGYKAQPHTATSITSTPSGKGSVYTYDDTGNTAVRDLPDTTQNLVWTPENKLDSITNDGKKTTYVYDADGNRLLENSPSGSTLYLGETELTTDATGKITRASRSYAPTVVRTTTNGATTGHKRTVLIADHLGTANTAVEQTTDQPITRRTFKPYGEVRGTKPTNWPNKRAYLGVGIDDTATGLTHIGAREYDQNSGRFLSADPVVDLADPLQMHGYAYSNNSPVSTSDPTGLMRHLDQGGSTTTPEDVADDPKWIADQTPETDDSQSLMSHFSESSPNGHNPDGNYWSTPIYENSGPSNACFGRLACAKAYRFLVKGGDPAEAKRIAATYCIENYGECHRWTDATRQQFQKFMSGQGIDFDYRPWG